MYGEGLAVVISIAKVFNGVSCESKDNKIIEYRVTILVDESVRLSNSQLDRICSRFVLL